MTSHVMTKANSKWPYIQLCQVSAESRAYAACVMHTLVVYNCGGWRKRRLRLSKKCSLILNEIYRKPIVLLYVQRVELQRWRSKKEREKERGKTRKIKLMKIMDRERRVTHLTLYRAWLLVFDNGYERCAGDALKPAHGDFHWASYHYVDVIQWCMMSSNGGMW